jgi:guanosine-3',5'-bis(diphosphate) 3'-pyrophosphohydrolase
MDLSVIQAFEHYQECFDPDPRGVLEEILQEAPYLTAEDVAHVRKAYEYARKQHAGQTRLSGEPYIIHPVKVLGFLMEMHPDVPSMQAALLHDVIEDCPATYEDILRDFGQDVADICEWLVKVAKVRYTWEDRALETLKKTFLAMAKDLRVIIIKLADRVHNIQTLTYHPKPEKAERIATETLKVYVPIAKRLGIYNFQGYLENGAFRILEPKSYEHITQYLEHHYGSNEMLLKRTALDQLTHECNRYNIYPQEIKWRLKSPYRIFLKLQKYWTNDITKIFDILAFRIVVDTVADCYTTLGLIHGKWTPIFSKLKDYIALPKPNGYKSLHTTILGMFDFPVEIQIRTPEMDEIAEYWVAAHFAYKEANKSVAISESQAKRIHELQELVQSYQDQDHQQEFRESLESELLQKDIFIYTPKGDIVQMPVGSTILDFAFRVHSEVGLKFRSWLINWKIVPIDYRLLTGDIVSVHTYKQKYTATRSWMQVLYTPSAKTKLNKYLRSLENNEIEQVVIALLNEKLKEYNLPLIDSKQDRITKKYKGAEFTQLMHKIFDKSVSLSKLVKDVYHDKLIDLQTQILQPKKEQTSSPSMSLRIDGMKHLSYTLCPECNPKPGDHIIAKTAKTAMKIHTITCKALKTVDYHKLYSATRDDSMADYYLHLHLDIWKKRSIIMQILKSLDFYGVKLKSLITHDSSIELSLIFTNPSKMGYIIDDIKSREWVVILSKELG